MGYMGWSEGWTKDKASYQNEYKALCKGLAEHNSADFLPEIAKEQSCFS